MSNMWKLYVKLLAWVILLVGCAHTQVTEPLQFDEAVAVVAVSEDEDTTIYDTRARVSGHMELNLGLLELMSNARVLTKVGPLGVAIQAGWEMGVRLAQSYELWLAGQLNRSFNEEDPLTGSVCVRYGLTSDLQEFCVDLGPDDPVPVTGTTGPPE